MLTLVVAWEFGDVVVLEQSLLDDIELFLFSYRVDDGLQSPCSSVVAGDLHEFLPFNLS